MAKKDLKELILRAKDIAKKKESEVEQETKAQQAAGEESVKKKRKKNNNKQQREVHVNGEVKAEVTASTEHGEEPIDACSIPFSVPKIEFQEELAFLDISMSVTHSFADVGFRFSDGTKLFSITYKVGGRIPCRVDEFHKVLKDCKKFLSKELNDFGKAVRKKCNRLHKELKEKGYIED